MELGVITELNHVITPHSSLLTMFGYFVAGQVKPYFQNNLKGDNTL